MNGLISATFPSLLRPIRLLTKQTSAPPTPEEQVAQALTDLQNGTPSAQARACQTLRDLAQSNLSSDILVSMVAPLITALSSTNTAVRGNAAGALAALAESNIPSTAKAEMIQPLISALNDAEGNVRANAASALWMLADSNILTRHKVTLLDPLLNALQDPDPSVRLNAIGGLSALAKSNISNELKARMVAPLTAALGDTNPNVRQNAASALRRLADENISIIPNEETAEPNDRGVGQWALLNLGERAFVLGNYQEAANALNATSERDAVYAPLLSQISTSLSIHPEAYEVQEVTLADGLKIRSFRRIDGSEADVHVFYSEENVLTVMTGETKLKWQSGDGNDHSFTLGSDSREINVGRIDLETLYQGTFGITTFENLSETLENNNLLLEFIRQQDVDLPRQIFDGLRYTVLSTKTADQLDFSGQYQRSPETITLCVSPDEDTVIHELAHHWDLWVTQEGRSDLSQIFYSISWNRALTARLDDELIDFRGATYPSCESHNCSAGPANSQLNINNSPHPYGMENEREDLAAFTESYYIEGANLRGFIREQMALGNFEPAVKYLFVKYFIFHEMEYGLGGESEAFNYDEIMEALSTFGTENIRETTLRALDDIRRLNGLE